MSRGGTKHYFRDPAWPKARVLSLGFTGLSDATVDEFFTFLAATLGKKIKITDWLGREWLGIILDPQGFLVNDGTDCQGRMAFKFRQV